MNYKIYTGEIASNASVNISCHGSFEAEDIVDALRKINFTVEYRNCEKWQIPVITDPKTFESTRPDYIEPLHDNLRWNPFVCVGDPFERNVVWKSEKAIINFWNNP
jgi:hypothetical protein